MKNTNTIQWESKFSYLKSETLWRLVDDNGAVFGTIAYKIGEKYKCKFGNLEKEFDTKTAATDWIEDNAQWSPNKPKEVRKYVKTLSDNRPQKFEYHLQKGTHKMIFDKLQEIADYFKCSITYVLKRIEENIEIHGYSIKRENLLINA